MDVPTPPAAGQERPNEEPGQLSRYGHLRWAIRLTGLLVMFGGVVYLIFVLSSLFLGRHLANPLDGLFSLTVSVVTLGLGIFLLRIGLRMFRSVDASTISVFSFLFAVVYTVFLMQILPLADLMQRNQLLLGLLLLVYFGLSYWMVRHILVLLLLRSR